MLVCKIVFSVNCATAISTPLTSNKTLHLYQFWKYCSRLFIEYTSNTHVPQASAIPNESTILAKIHSNICLQTMVIVQIHKIVIEKRHPPSPPGPMLV